MNIRIVKEKNAVIRERKRIHADRRSALRRIRRRRRIDHRKRLREFKELFSGLLVGALISLIFVVIIIFPEEPYAPDAPEHYDQIEYCGQWFDIDDYNTMMQEREEYFAAEREKEQEFFYALEKIREEEVQ